MNESGVKSGERLHNRRSGFLKLVAMTGGLLILIGIVLLGLAALAFSGFLDARMLLEGKYFLTFALAMVAVGLLDTVAAVVISRW